MPDADHVVAPSTFAQAVGQLKEKKIFRFASPAAQTKVNVVQKWARRLVADKSPDLEYAESCPLVQSVALRFRFFIRHTYVPAGSETPVTVFGVDAVKENNLLNND